MTLRHRAVVVLALVVLGTLLFASGASAATSAWSSIDITFLGDQQQPVLLVAGTLPADAKLPYKGELAVPAGSGFLWLGEIVGQDPSKDPDLQYTKRTEGELDIYSFTMTTSKTAQLEITPPDPSTSDGTNTTTQLRWKSWVDVPSVRIAERVPAGSQVVQEAPGATLQPVDSQYASYWKTVQNVKAGDVVELAFTYKPGAPAPTGSSAGSSVPATGTAGQATTGTKQPLNGLLLPIVVVLLVVVSVAFVRVSKSGSAEAAETVAAEPKPKQPAVKASVDDAFFDEDEIEAAKPASAPTGAKRPAARKPR